MAKNRYAHGDPWLCLLVSTVICFQTAKYQVVLVTKSSDNQFEQRDHKEGYQPIDRDTVSDDNRSDEARKEVCEIQQGVPTPEEGGSGGAWGGALNHGHHSQERTWGTVGSFFISSRFVGRQGQTVLRQGRMCSLICCSAWICLTYRVSKKELLFSKK